LSVLTKRYAAALADVALERDNAAEAKEGLAGFVGAFSASLDLRNFLASPAVPKPAKQAVIEKLGARLRLSPAVRNFLFLIVDHRRMGLLGEIRQAFETELDARLGIAEAEVTSARDLTDGEKKDLTETLARLTGKRIEARYGLDAGLIGGAVVRIGSTVYDGSVRQQLQRLRARLEAE
jgi:F-type H+-transporting ATPase subunit delta